MGAINKRRIELSLLLPVILLASCASSPVQRDPVSHETTVRHARPRLDHEKFDPQEFDPALVACFGTADAKAEREVGNVTRNDEFILTFWKEKKRLLRQQCGIDWQSPAELNPEIEYDDYGQPTLTAAELLAAHAVVSANLVTPDEQIGYGWRTFTGQVFIVTRAGNPPVVRHYELHGHDGAWEFVSVGILEE